MKVSLYQDLFLFGIRDSLPPVLPVPHCIKRRLDRVSNNNCTPRRDGSAVGDHRPY